MAKDKSPFQTIFKKNPYEIKQMQKKSVSWYSGEIDKIKKQRITPNRLLKDNLNNTSNIIIPRQLYFYNYDPKHKATLDYYDTWPMVFPFRLLNDGFIGLNMHYLPYVYRIQLFNALYTLAKNNRLDDSTKLNLSWDAIKGLSKFKLAEPCVHRYLSSHIRTKPILIESENWISALMLPVARFKKKTESYVWLDSLYGK